MAVVSVALRSVPDTQAAVGWAGGHTLVIDRPEGRAGGMGLGFNGAQMIGLAIGGCFCNDLRYVAEKMAIAVISIAVDVNVTLEGSPLVVVAAELIADIQAEAGADIGELLRRADTESTIGNSVRSGFPVTVRAV